MYKLWFYLDDEMFTQIFNSFDDMIEFIINSDVEIFNYEYCNTI